MKLLFGALIASAALATPIAAQQHVPLDLRKCERSEITNSKIVYECYITSKAARGSFEGRHYSIVSGYTGPDSAFESTVRNFASRAQIANTLQARADYAKTYRLVGHGFGGVEFCRIELIGDGIRFLADSTQERFSERVVACSYETTQKCTTDKGKRVCTETPILVPRSYIESTLKQ